VTAGADPGFQASFTLTSALCFQTCRSAARICTGALRAFEVERAELSRLLEAEAAGAAGDHSPAGAEELSGSFSIVAGDRRPRCSEGGSWPAVRILEIVSHGAGAAPSRDEDISLAEPAPAPCDTDLEDRTAGQLPPSLHEAGESPATIENDPEKLFRAGWGVIPAAPRPRFEKAGEFGALDFDIVEELRCKCEPRSGKAGSTMPLVNVKLAWKPGSGAGGHGRS